MKRSIFIGFLLALCFTCALFLVGLFLLQQNGKGALQVTANVKSRVYLNDALLGETPYKNEALKVGIYQIKLVPQDTSFATFTIKATITDKILTAIDRTFLPGALSSAYLLTLERNPSSSSQLFVQSLPDKALVLLDGNPTGTTPYLIKETPASEHEVEIYKEGFHKKTIRVKTKKDFKLIAQVYLGTEAKVEDLQPTIATQSATLSPTPSVSETSSAPIVIIKSTPTGFLRVRENPSVSAAEIGRVKPTEEYELLEEQDNWFKIKLADKEGWISSTYAQKKITPSP